ncbi:hypothetical protein WJX82_006088 [Trebouxia sp. C0006]
MSSQARRATCNTRVELAVLLHSMVNLDLYSQGWYAVRVSIEPCAMSTSLNITAQECGTQQDLSSTPLYLRRQLEKSGLRSHVFLVRYIQQEVPLHQTVSLALHQVADQDATSLECTLKLELLYQPLVHARSSEPPAELQLTCLAQQSYHLSGLEQGLHAFQPVVFASPDLAVCNVTVHSLALQQMEGKITYRASDDIEGELGRQIDSCMLSALSQCWGGPPIQSVNPKPVVSQAQSAYQSSHQQDGIQNHQEMMTKFGPDRQAQSKQPPSGSMQSDGIKRSPATQSHAVHSVFDSLADMEQDQEESIMKSWSSGVEGLQESQAVKHEDEGLDVGLYNSIRAVLAGNAGSKGGSQSPGTIQQSAEALSRLLITFATSACYPQLQLLRAKLFKSTDATDWVCLLWLLQKAPEEVTRGLKAEWQKGQVQEFATWVRPASELSAVRSKAAAKLMRQQLRELSITSQSRPSSSKPSMANLTIHIGHSPLSITSPNGPTALGQPKGGSHMPGLAPNKASPGAGSVQPSSPSRLWLGSTPPLHPTSPTRGAAGLISPVQRSGPSKGGLRWGRWGRSPHPSQANSPHFQSSDPSRNWPEEMGSPVIQSSSPSRNWAGPEGNSLVQSTSPSRNWAGPGGNWGVQSSSPSRAWGAATPPVQSSAPSFLKGWLSKQRGHSVAEELAMEAFRLQLALQAGQLESAGPSGPSHGSDSRFAAMKSLTRHAISLDSPTKLETCRRRGTLVPRKALAAGRSLESGLDQVPAGYDFDLGINLSPASSAGDSAASSFTNEGHQQLREQLPIEASHLEVVASSQSLGHAWPMDPGQDKQHQLEFPTSTSAQQAGAWDRSDPGIVVTMSGPLVDSITAGTAPCTSERSDGNVGGHPSERHQGVARVLSKLPSLQSMTQRLRATSHKAMLPGTVDEAKEEYRLVSASVSTSEAHVVVFVHGFRGSARDLGAVRSHMQLAQPDLDYLMSKCNQDRTADGLQTMGHRLAAEVAQYLQDFENGKQRRLDKLSFVGHSIGNLIIRAALTEPVLKAYLPSLWLFLSLSGPHLGYLCSANKLFCSGMWLFKKFTAGRTLHELTFTDAPELKDCYLHNLAAAPSLTLFKCVLLAASPQDQYVPFDSTRIQSPKAEQQGRRATAQRGMARKLLHGADGSQNTRLIRVDVDFPVKQWKSVNNAVGRTAHLAFVESEAFIRFLVWSVLQPRQLI